MFYATNESSDRKESPSILESRSSIGGDTLDCTGFEARGRVFQSERQLHGAAFVFTSEYDNADRMTATTLLTGRVIQNRYDGLSQVTGATEAVSFP